VLLSKIGPSVFWEVLGFTKLKRKGIFMKNKQIIATSLVSLVLLAGCGAEDQGTPPPPNQ
jgi:hypothetical protein